MKKKHSDEKANDKQTHPEGASYALKNPREGANGKGSQEQEREAVAAPDPKPPFPLMIVQSLGEWFLVFHGAWHKLHDEMLTALREDVARKLKQKL